MTKEQIKILRLGKISGVEWFDFVQVPQGYIHICGSSVRKPKGHGKFKHIEGSLIDPTDDQIIAHAKNMMRHSEKNSDNYEFIITTEDFREIEN